MRNVSKNTATRQALAVVLGLGLIFGQVATASATQVPDPSSSLFLQTSGPNAGISIGDYYTAPGGGNTDHLFIVRVPSNWPDGIPVTLSLYDPELAGPNPSSPTAADEIRGGADSATFRLESPSGSTVATASYSDSSTNGVWIDLATFDPGITGTGTYELHVSVSDDDDNSWRVDASHDPDCAVGGPDSCGQSNLQDGDESDTAPGGSSPLGLGVVRTSYQHAGSGLVCLDHVFFVNDSTPRPLRSHNFDMDNNGSVEYTTPAGAVVSGTVSGNGVWNGSTNTNRVGDVLPDVNGWWTAEVCISTNNQYVFEAPSAGPSFPVLQPQPRLTIEKDDGASSVDVGDEITYTITVSNVSDGDPMPGDAHAIEVEDILPAGVQFVECSAHSGISCGQSGGVVTIEHDTTLAPGDEFGVDITVLVEPDVATTLVNTVTVEYEDGLGNGMPGAEDQDSDVVRFNPALDIEVAGATEVLLGESATLAYQLSHSASSDGSAVSDVTWTCPPCTSLTYVSGDDNSDGILDGDEIWVYTALVDTDASTPDPLKVKANVSGLDRAGGVVQASATHKMDVIEPGTIAGSVFEDLNGDGNHDSGEPGIEGVEVLLGGGSGTMVAVTAADGSYQFVNLLPGVYDVEVDRATVSKTMSATGDVSSTVDLDEADSVTGVEFGYARPVTLAGTVYHDANLNGIKDNSEEGLRGVKVKLYDNRGTLILKTHAHKSGAYEFTVMPGDYTIVLGSNIPPGWTATSQDTLTSGSVLSGGSMAGLDFGVGNQPPELTVDSQTVAVGQSPTPVGAEDPEGGDVTFSLVGGRLPPGTSLEPNGSFSGAASVPGTYLVNLELCDDADPEACAEYEYTIVVSPAEVDDNEVLPFTGLDVGPLTILAIVLMGSGLSLLIASRLEEEGDQIAPL